jgi:hypothetical protein
MIEYLGGKGRREEKKKQPKEGVNRMETDGKRRVGIRYLAIVWANRH